MPSIVPYHHGFNFQIQVLWLFTFGSEQHTCCCLMLNRKKTNNVMLVLIIDNCNFCNQINLLIFVFIFVNPKNDKLQYKYKDYTESFFVIGMSVSVLNLYMNTSIKTSIVLLQIITDSGAQDFCLR